MEMRMFAAIHDFDVWDDDCNFIPVRKGSVYFLDKVTADGFYCLTVVKNDICPIVVSGKQLQEDFMELDGDLEVEVHIDHEEDALVIKTCLNGYYIAEERKTYINKNAVNKTCMELDSLLTNACDFIFTDGRTYDAVERDKITEIIYNYMNSLSKEALYDRESMDEIERRRRRNPYEWSK